MAERDLPTTAVDPDDTSRCPMALWCESCGDGAMPLELGVAVFPEGMTCVTTCANCVDAAIELPAFRSPMAVLTRVGEHAAHLASA